MEKSLIFAALSVGFVLLDTVSSFPVDISSVGEGGSNPLWLTNYIFTGFGFFLMIIAVIFGCVCCRNGKGFKEFSNSSGNLAVPRIDGFVNPTLNSELTIFPPLGANANEICRFEPLPDIKCQAQNLRPAAFSYTEQEISSQDWFGDPHSNFPRSQLKYVQEYGRGWFGRVVEGEAQNISPEEKVTKVMVKILHEDATPTDHMYFLHEVKFYRDLKHPNILRLLGQCLEMEPFLVMLECYPNGDLKSFLSQNLASAQALVEQGVTLRMCSNITAGLQFMHEKKFIHTDLAARNCLVGPDLTIKIGDYGNSIEIFRTDYYCAGSVALPVRWCAPETLKCTDITIETREVTPPANVWSLGVVFWEICEFCKLPYAELNDDQVIVRVLGEKNYFLEKPTMFCLHKDELYHLMKLCWKAPLQRPSAAQINVILNNLISSGRMNQNEIEIDSKRISQDFEQRWQNLKPNSIPKKDNAVEVESSAPVDCSIIPLKLKNAKVADSSLVDSPLGVFMTNRASGQDSPRFCLKFDREPGQKSRVKALAEASEGDRQVPAGAGEEGVAGQSGLEGAVGKVEFDCSGELKGRAGEVDSWLKGVEINNEEDESFVRKISEAIRDLDATLALEKTSSSEENSGKSSRQNSPGKDVKEGSEVTVDFRLGQDTSSFMNFAQKTFELSSLQNTEQPQSLSFADAYSEKSRDLGESYGSGSLMLPLMGVGKCKGDVLDESLKENDSLLCGQSRNSSDTDDEVWRRRIEKGEISEKVKEKSKSIANLMILTHIDSDDSDIDLDKPDKGLHRSSFLRRSGSFAKSSVSSNNFGSENDLTFAVLEEDFKESLKKLSNDHRELGRFDSLGVILPSSANRENVWENLFKPSGAEGEAASPQTDVNRSREDSSAVPAAVPPEGGPTGNTQAGSNFLANAASEKLDNGKLATDCEGESSAPSCEEVGTKSGEGSVEAHSHCDSEARETNCADPPEKSSHLGESFVADAADEGSPPTNGAERSKLAAESSAEGSVQNKKEKNWGSNGAFEVPEGQTHEERDLKSESEEALPESRGSGLVPEITVSEEVEDEVEAEGEEEVFVLEAPGLRPFRFVLKEAEVGPATSFGEGAGGAGGGGGGGGAGGGSVIVGACEDFTMDYFRGLKTASEGFGGREEDLEVWGEHLERALRQQLSKANFEEVRFRSVCPGWGEREGLAEFLEAERVHTERVEEGAEVRGLGGLSVVASEEEYEHFKLRTPDDERSSDSGFRDKGSLSESVEDGCEGKYNLEDIEAELEEAFVKGVFGNCEAEKEKESRGGSRGCSIFEYEESKFYEDKNEEDLSDIDGEIEFWQNKDDSDYYPEISEFNPTCSRGWYLHPPDESAVTYERTINEDIVNALRNELEENLPVQSRSFDEFSDFYEPEAEGTTRDLTIHYMSEFSLPLSPIPEEQDLSASAARRSAKSSLLDGGSAKAKKSVLKLMESAKAMDTSTFMQYLDYMVESEGKELWEAGGAAGGGGGAGAGAAEGGGCGRGVRAGPGEWRAAEEVLVVDVETNEATLVGGVGPEAPLTDSSDNDGLVFTPEMLSPDRERSLSEVSRTGDALSEITLSSPDLVPDCFSALGQEAAPSEGAEKLLQPTGSAGRQREGSRESDALESSFQYSKPKELPKSSKACEADAAADTNDSYEMSTSFMGDDNDEEDTFSSSEKAEHQRSTEEPKDAVDDSDAVDWQSDSSGDEELSSSSEEFIWKLYERAEREAAGAAGGGEAAGEGEEDEDDESSTGSSASFTDFVPSAWNSQATPGRSALKSPDSRADKGKKSVWFKKQKYHCVYEYPREPSDSEEADGSPFALSAFEGGVPETPLQHFRFGVSAGELASRHFPYGVPKAVDLSAYTDWDVVEGEDLDLSLTDTDSDNGSGKGDATPKTIAATNFYNLSPFDYDFSATGVPEAESEFLVSSSSRPFQGGSSGGFAQDGRAARSEAVGSKDFVTPDSGIEDSASVTPLEKVGPREEKLCLQVGGLAYPSAGIMDILDNLKFSFASDSQEGGGKDVDLGAFDDSASSKNGFAPCNASAPLPDSGLGKLKHARGRLKLDLPRNHNAELGTVILNVRKE